MKRIFIANRGEIAIRIAKSIRELGHIAVGAWTSNEPDAAHLVYCDEWVKLVGNTHLETFLNIDQLIKIMKKNNIDAVHPGYGFLAENDDFARAVVKEGIRFIGPKADIIQLMGDKAESKKIARKANVSVVPGTEDVVKSVMELKSVAKKVGYPVMLKAVAGGGGKGMRICENEQELLKNFDIVQREAKSSFGKDGVLLEKFIQGPRHIEVQILGDRRGNIFHLFERECSVQRRHQKVIEEAPSPFIGENKKLRTEICETALRLARFVNYDSAGTVEFIMGEDQSFYFLEMNTRIQVEHTVTEEVTGIDIMRQMIKGALGDEFDFQKQEEINLNGHSLQCRICIEDPISFLPAPGIVTGLEMSFPQGVRFDHCLFVGLNIGHDFDPMVGKLVTFGFNRVVAMEKMREALERLNLEGVKTNILLHIGVLKNRKFIEGVYTTDFLKQENISTLVGDPFCWDTVISRIAGIENLNSEH